jgi:RND family efflux transporter MFP subunit
MKYGIFIASLIALAACGERAEKLTQLPKGEELDNKSAAVSVQTAPALRMPVDRAVLATGTTEPVRSANLGPQMTARINSVLVHEGDEVKQGAPLVRLDVADAELRLRQSEASAASTQAQYALAASEYERLAPLAAQGTITAQNLTRLSGQRDALKAAADAANVASENAKQNLSYAQVKAPFAGVISRVHVEVGEVATMMPPMVLVRLVDLSSVDVRMRVHERDLARIQAGDPVSAHFSSTGERLAGSIAFISPEIDPQTRTAEVVTRIPNEQRTLRAGMFAEIEVRSRDRHEGIVIPASALIKNGDAQTAFVVTDGTLEKRDVKALPIDAAHAEVLDGIKEGEHVVSAEVTRLSAGLKVTEGPAKGGGEK